MLYVAGPIFAKFDWFICEDHARADFNAFWTSRTNIELAIERNNWKFHTIFEKHEGWSDEKKFQLKSSLSNHYFAKIQRWPFASVSWVGGGGWCTTYIPCHAISIIHGKVVNVYQSIDLADPDNRFARKSNAPGLIRAFRNWAMRRYWPLWIVPSMNWQNSFGVMRRL